MILFFLLAIAPEADRMQTLEQEIHTYRIQAYDAEMEAQQEMRVNNPHFIQDIQEAEEKLDLMRQKQKELQQLKDQQP